MLYPTGEKTRQPVSIGVKPQGKMDKKKIPKLIVAFIAFIFVMEIIAEFTIHRRPEIKEDKQFILKNEEVRKIYGDNIQARYSKDGAEIVNFLNRTELMFRFEVTGEKDHGYIRVYGEKKKGEPYKILKIDTDNDFEQSKIIWQLAKVLK